MVSREQKQRDLKYYVIVYAYHEADVNSFLFFFTDCNANVALLRV